MEFDGDLKVSDVEALKTPAELWEVLRSYNWDDGYEIPNAIAQHPQCDLWVALDLFWLANAISVYLKEFEFNLQGHDWIDFCERLTTGILTGAYKPGLVKFEGELCKLGKVGAYKLRKRGVPEILITGSCL